MTRRPCPVCDRHVAHTRAGDPYPHGPANNRCPGGQWSPAEADTAWLHPRAGRAIRTVTPNGAI